MTFNRNRAKNSESGVALVLALLTLLLITAAALGMITMTNTETNISANFRDESIAFFAARAGAEEIRDRIRTSATNSLNTSLPTALPGGASSVLYVTNPSGGETVTPWLTTGSNYPDTEICKELTCTSNVPPSGYNVTPAASASTSYAASPILPWKWVRIAVKTNKSAAGTGKVNSVDGTTSGNRVCWNGTNEVVTTAATCGTNSPVYVVTAFAATPSRSHRMVQYELVNNINVPVVAALFTKNSTNTGQALNVTGATDPVCSMPSTYGAASGTSTVTTPGGGNVTGSPAGTVNTYGWTLGDLSGMIAPFLPTATNITTVSGISSPSGSPPNYTLANGNLGTAPTVTYNGSSAISAITSPGTPVTYVTPTVGTLTLGGGTGGINGQGVLIVRGNLTIDVSNGFNYFGLIVVTGNITMISSTNASVSPHIHGAIISAGSFTAPISNFSGSISLHQNACMVQQALGSTFYNTVAIRELMY
jgi:Tfp pilus assembly protein PilX